MSLRGGRDAFIPSNNEFFRTQPISRHAAKSGFGAHRAGPRHMATWSNPDCFPRVSLRGAGVSAIRGSPVVLGPDAGPALRSEGSGSIGRPVGPVACGTLPWDA